MRTELKQRWRSTRAEAEQIKACAEAHKVSARAVRAWRRSNDSRWQKWLASRAQARIGELEIPAIAAAGRTTTPEVEEAFASQRLVLLQQELDAAIGRGESASFPPLLKALGEAQKLLHTCRIGRMEYEVATKRLVRIEEVQELRRRFVEPLGNIIRNMPSEIGPKANSFDPAQGIAACEDWLRNRFNPQLEKAREAFGKDAANSENQNHENQTTQP